RGRGRDPGHDLTRRKSRGEVALTAKIGQSPAPAHGAEMPAGDTGGDVAAGSALPDVAAPNSPRQATDFAVIIVGAGLSGIGVAYHLQRDCPRKSFIILEARSAIGGTWDLFRYPGVRSDSDMHTLGYRFRPWRGEESIAGGPAILAYLEDTAREYGIERKIRFRHKVTRPSWSSEDARWTLDVMGPVGGMLTYACHFLQMCSGYYDYDAGYMRGWPGMERFQGEILHPQQWPEDLDYAGKKVVVIGSGATAVTLVPAMTDKAAHVTMLQRSPTYIMAMPAEDALANRLRSLLGARRAYPIARWKNVLSQTLFYQLSRRAPGLVRSLIRRANTRLLPSGYDVDTHFKPRYRPWDQRLCLVPDGDLFRAIRRGSASVVTDRIATFTESGLRLESGAELDADVV